MMYKKLILFVLSLALGIKLFAQESEYRQDMSEYDVHFYHLNIELSDTSTFITGNTIIHASVISDTLNRIVLDLASALTVDSVLLNNDSVYFKHLDDIIICDSIPLILANENFVINVYYKGKNEGDNTFFKGGVYTDYNDYVDINTSWTMSEPYSAKKWFACKQDLTDKADSSYFYITIPDNLQAGSNGLLKRVVPLDDNKQRYEWESSYPISYYLISATIGDFMEYSFYAHPKGTNDSLLIQNYIYNDSSYFDKNKALIDRTAEIVELFSEVYGMYPFMNEKYGHCTSPIGGGMEHQTMTTINNFNFLLVAHELSHMWFGDYVTCSSWNDIWINEGFASYSEYIALENLESKNDATDWLLQVQKKALLTSDGSVYIPSNELDDPWRIFNSSLSYKKGACLLHMIRFEINNDSVFFEVLKTFLSKYKNSIAGAEEFKSVLEEVSNIDFTYFFQQWYYGYGYPIYTISWTQENDTLTITSSQKSSSEKTSFFETDFEITVRSIGKDSTFRFRQTQNDQEYKIYYPDIVTNVVFDPNYHLLKKINPIAQKIACVPENKLFKVNPNPCNDKFKLHFKNQPENCIISISNVDGKIIHKSIANEKNIEFDVTNWKSGIYLINVLYNNSLYSEKVIKN